jgi:hypothetical protein
LHKNASDDHVLDWLGNRVERRIDRFDVEFRNALEATNRRYYDSDITELIKLWIPDDTSGRQSMNQLSPAIEAIAERWPLTLISKDSNAIAQQLYEEWKAIRPSAELKLILRKAFITGQNQQHDDDFALLEASVTFNRWVETKPRFVFRMAGRQIYRLKALARGMKGSAPVLVVPQMYAVLKPDRKLIQRQRLLRLAGEAEAVDSNSDDDTF